MPAVDVPRCPTATVGPRRVQELRVLELLDPCSTPIRCHPVLDAAPGAPCQTSDELADFEFMLYSEPTEEDVERSRSTVITTNVISLQVCGCNGGNGGAVITSNASSLHGAWVAPVALVARDQTLQSLQSLQSLPVGLVTRDQTASRPSGLAALCVVHPPRTPPSGACRPPQAIARCLTLV